MRTMITIRTVIAETIGGATTTSITGIPAFRRSRGKRRNRVNTFCWCGPALFFATAFAYEGSKEWFSFVIGDLVSSSNLRPQNQPALADTWDFITAAPVNFLMVGTHGKFLQRILPFVVFGALWYLLIKHLSVYWAVPDCPGKERQVIAPTSCAY